VTANARENLAILPISVGTDPGLTMKTRRGTGYYKVPSLKGVWYRACSDIADGVPPLKTGWIRAVLTRTTFRRGSSLTEQKRTL
jgi:hypothetical protein